MPGTRPERLRPKKHICVCESPNAVVIAPIRGQSVPFVGMVSIDQGHGDAVVGIVSIYEGDGVIAFLAACPPEQVSDRLAARITALMVAHAQCPILHPVLNPRIERPGFVMLLASGAIADTRWAFSPQFVAEIDRLADVLSAQHSQYVQSVAEALRGRRPASFGVLPTDMGITDPADECSWAPPPPAITVNVAELTPYDDPETLFHLVNLDYRNERYLQNLSDDNVLERALDALVNTHNFEAPHRILIDVDDSAIVRAMARLGEAAEELRLRHGDAALRSWITKLAPRWGTAGVGGTTDSVCSAVHYGIQALAADRWRGEVRAAGAPRSRT